jgi:tetratricopeptide (TPR) repeat protein
MDDVVESLDRVERLLYAERADEARSALGAIGDSRWRVGPLSGERADPGSLAPDLRDRARVLSLRADAMREAPADRLAVSARRWRAEASGPAWRARFSAELAARLADKRCEELARAEGEAAIDALPGSALGHDALARVHLAFDRRAEALAAWQGALGLGEGWRAQLGVVRVSYVTGRFDLARETLAAVAPNDATRVSILRWRLLLARVDRDWEECLRASDAIIEHTRGGYRWRWDLLGRASTLDWLGRRADAVEAYRAVWREKEDDACGRFAREVLNGIERAAGGRRAMLPAFPTTAQKRDYCGPAVLELVLRHLGVDADQDAIATTVKLPDGGSPMIRIVRYLEAQGLATRRFEGTAARIRACIERGLPVIVQEEYSTTQHVAVVVGVDEELGLLFVQDPMTHATAERLIGTEERLGQLFRQAAVVAHRKGDEGSARALDEADVKDQEHIRLVDSCDDEEVSRDVEEMLARCKRAVAVCDDYPLAWHRQAWELLWLAQRYDSRANVDRFLAMLRRVRVRYARAEWPHQVHARYLMWQKRHEEALIEYEDALRIDPGDANNAQYIAELHSECDRAKEATEGWWHALELDPSHVRATENFASHALEQGDVELAEHLSRCAIAMAPDNPFNHCTASRVAEKLGQCDEAVALARKAVEVDAEWTPGTRRLAELLRKRPETREEALELVSKLVKRWPGWFAPRLEAASILREAGRVDEAVALLKEGIEAAEDEPDDLLREAVETLLDEGRVDEGLALARQVAGDDAPMGIKVVRLQMLRRERRDLEATVLARALVRDHEDMGYAVSEACESLPDDEAEVHLRRILELAPTFRDARGRLVIRLLGRKPEDAVRYASSPGTDADTWLLALRAAGLGDLQRWEEAEKTARRVYELDDDYQPGVHELVRALVADGDPREALARLRAAGAGDVAATRARLCIAMAVGELAEALECAALLPENDPRATRSLQHVAEVDRSMRPLLEARLKAALEEELPEAEERWFRAALAGSRGASGDVEAFERALAEARPGSPVLAMSATLEDMGHRALRERIAARAAELEPDSPAALWDRAFLAREGGDRASARALFERATELYPLDQKAWQYLGGDLLLDLEPRAHEVIDTMAGMSAASFRCQTDALVVLSLVLRGRRAEAVRFVVHARGLVCAEGTPMSLLSWEPAAFAAVAGDRAGLDAAAARSACKDAKLWEALRAAV